MNKNVGLAVMLVVIALVTILVEPNFNQPSAYLHLILYTGLYGILALGAGFAIMTGGIDLSMGSMVCLSATMFALLLGPQFALSPWLCFAAVIGTSLLVGLFHGFLITRMNLQPFIVTLCGLFIYRGVARTISDGEVQGFGSDPHGLRWMSTGDIFDIVPMPFVILCVIALVAAVFLKKTTYGTYILALGKNEKAAAYSGVNTKKMIIISYMICSLMAGVAGLLFALNENSVNPSTFGNFFELYAIAGAVLGGCSLRGGYGSILGIVLGTALVQLIEMSTTFLKFSDESQFTVVGCIILIGVLSDEILGKYYKRKKQREHQEKSTDNKSIEE